MGFAGSKGASDRDILIPSVCFQLRGRPFIKPTHAKKSFDCKPLAWRSDHVANSMNAYFNQVHLINWLFYWRWCFYYSIPFSFNGFTSCSIADLLNLAHKIRHSRQKGLRVTGRLSTSKLQCKRYEPPTGFRNVSKISFQSAAQLASA